MCVCANYTYHSETSFVTPTRPENEQLYNPVPNRCVVVFVVVAAAGAGVVGVVDVVVAISNIC